MTNKHWSRGIKMTEQHPNETEKKESRAMLFRDITRKIINFGKDSPTYWGCALAGEVGELCNMIKKIERDHLSLSAPYHHDGSGTQTLKEAIANELADIFIETELNARFFGIDLESAIITKIEIVNKKRQKRTDS